MNGIEILNRILTRQPGFPRPPANPEPEEPETTDKETTA